MIGVQPSSKYKVNRLKDGRKRSDVLFNQPTEQAKRKYVEPLIA